jgi:hypothetical protein
MLSRFKPNTPKANTHNYIAFVVCHSDENEYQPAAIPEDKEVQFGPAPSQKRDERARPYWPTPVRGFPVCLVTLNATF